MKDRIKTIKELSKNPRGKALIFFGLYFVFFCILFILMGVSSKQERNFDYEVGTPYSFNTTGIITGNYYYTYTITIDGKQDIIKGKKNDGKELLNYNNKEYFVMNDNYFVKDKVWIKSEKPFKYGDFLNPNKILALIDKSMYESTTNYENGKSIYNFLVSTNTINKEWYNMNTDYDEIPNRIVVNTERDSVVNKLLFNLDSYCVLNKMCNKEMKVELNFEEYGEVEEIVNPLE